MGNKETQMCKMSVGVRGVSAAWVPLNHERSRSENYSEASNTAGWSGFVNKVL